MKNLLKIGVLVMVLLNSAVLYANSGDFPIKVKDIKEKSVAFFIEGPQTIDLSIYGSDDEVLYEQTINALGSSTKTYNLDAFPDGNYTFKLANESKSAEYKVLIERGKVQVSEPVVLEKFKPVFTKKDEFITLNLENAPEGPIEVEILNKYNESVYNKVFKGAAIFAKRFNVAHVYTDELTFVIKSKDQEVKQIVSMR